MEIDYKAYAVGLARQHFDNVVGFTPKRQAADPIDAAEYTVSRLHEQIAHLTHDINGAFTAGELRKLLWLRQEIEPLIAALESASQLALHYADKLTKEK